MSENKQKNAKKLFEETRDRYDEVEKKFAIFRFSPQGIKHEETLNSFIHESRRVASNVGFCLLKGTVPNYGVSSIRWVDYNNLVCAIGMMELILELWETREENSFG